MQLHFQFSDSKQSFGHSENSGLTAAIETEWLALSAIAYRPNLNSPNIWIHPCLPADISEFGIGYGADFPQIPAYHEYPYEGEIDPLPSPKCFSESTT